MSTEDDTPKSIDEIAAAAFDAVEAGADVPEAEPLEIDEDQTVEAAAQEPPAEEPAEDPVEGPVQEVGEQEEAAEPEEPAIEDRAPSSWKREVAEKWGELPAEARAEIQRREADYHKGIEQYKQYAGIGHEVEKAITPYLQNIQAAGVAPIEAMQKLFEADHMLRNSTAEQKAQYFSHLAQEYGIDLATVQPPEPVDPAVLELRKQNQELQRFQRSVVERENQTALSEIERFQNDPANVHFEAVKDDMSLLLQSGKATSLKDAYEMAVWMRPDIRKSLVEEQRTEAEKTAIAQAREKRAKAAAVGVKGSAPSKGGVLKPGTDLRGIVAAAVAGDI